MLNDCLEQAHAFWLTRRLRYLVPLKYTHLYSDVVTCTCDRVGASFGALLHYATRDIFWDVGMYPASDRILIPTASDADAARRLVLKVRQQFTNQALVFKFSEPTTRDLFLAAFPAVYARTLISYTAPHSIDTAAANPAWQTDTAVQITSAPDATVCRLYRANGYTDSELQHYFAGGAQAFTLFEGDTPVCTCMVYQNFDTIWEVGGLHTLPAARRRGYARRVVETALTVLAERELMPRYLVDSTNTASVRLAESLGLQIALNFEHYVCSQVRNIAALT